MIISGSASQALAAALARELEEPLAAVEYDRFPDGELLAAVPDLANGEADRTVVVASTVSSDAHLEVLQLQDAAHEAGVEEVVTVLPYMGYGRQDEAFEAGHPISARAVARAVSTGSDRVLTVNPHENAVCEFFDPTATAIDAADRSSSRPTRVRSTSPRRFETPTARARRTTSRRPGCRAPTSRFRRATSPSPTGTSSSSTTSSRRGRR
jgi:ribose-phosphate pyrophosphokinase